jgi:hypothetical protein
MTLLARKRVVACKVETTPGTAIALSASDAVFNVFDATIQPTIEFVSRMGQAAFGSITGSVGQASGTLTFRTELFGDGAAGVPSWASTLLPACGFTNSAGTFSPKSEAPGSNVKTLTMGLYEDGVFKSIRGAVGNCVITIVPGKPVDLNWTFTGAWVTPTDVAILAPTYPTLLPMRAAAASITIGAVTPCFSSMTIDFGNVITPRTCAVSANGLHSFIITNRMPVGTIDPESKLVATYAPYSDWITPVERVLTAVLVDSTDEITFTGSKFQLTNVQEAEREGLQTDTLTYQLNRGNSGNDELTIAFSGP